MTKKIHIVVFFFWKKSYKKLLNNLSLLHIFFILTITYILYADDEGYTSVVNLPLKQ